MGDDKLPPPATGDETDEHRNSSDTNPAASGHSGSRLYRDCIEHSPYGVMVHDAAGRILLFNSRLEALSGFRREEIPDVSTWIESLYPDPAYRRILLEHRGAGPRDGQVRIREALITRKDGQRRMCRFTSATLSDGTRIVFIRDIHDTAEFIGGRSLVPVGGSAGPPAQPHPGLRLGPLRGRIPPGRLQPGGGRARRRAPDGEPGGRRPPTSMPTRRR